MSGVAFSYGLVNYGTFKSYESRGATREFSWTLTGRWLNRSWSAWTPCGVDRSPAAQASLAPRKERGGAGGTGEKSLSRGMPSAEQAARGRPGCKGAGEDTCAEEECAGGGEAYASSES
ncbi:hypothetical protein E2562_000026 [Oryza meyeriana var. granulata]|uniref:Uncharacterized protein n=1 Tax=Oryza meyeriana var. granulata TaxID=110450 RepID=A0A6G1DB75_9ORYZ|nr:hypothetical protein E2562_000026 [Oryza meyeriana var. granulata]